MAQYYTDFDSSNYSLGDITTQGWTHRWEGTPTANVIDDTDASNGRALEVVADAGNTNMLLSWDTVDDAGRDQLDILCRQKINSNSGTVHHGVAGRASGGATDPTGYAGHQKKSNSIQLIRFNGSNNRTDLAESGTGGVVTTGTYYFVRLKITGSNPTTLELTRWEGTLSDEPASPDITYDDSSVDEITQAGWVGVFKRAGNTYTWDWIGVGTNGDAAPTEPVSSGTADNAVITSAAATPLTATDSTASTDNATLTSAVASVIASTDTTQSTDSAQTTSVSASVLSSTGTSAATDTASLTGASAAVLTATAQSIATDAAAIVTASATPLTSTETTGGSGSTETDSALITGAAASPLTGTESAQSTDTAAITAVGSATLTATEAAVSTDGATITPASVTIQTSAETATALDNAVIVNAQGTPLATIESVQTDANITTVTVTPLTASETSGTAEILLGTPEITAKLSAEPNTVPVLKASPAVVAKLKANLKVTPE